MLKDKQIWVFKEGRAGSNWFCHALEKKIKRTAFHYERERYLDFHLYRTGKDPEFVTEVFKKEAIFLRDKTKFYATPYLEFLYHAHLLHKDTILIRLTRKNRVEHCLSILAFLMFSHSSRTHSFVNPITMLGNRYASTDFYSKPEYVTKQQVKKIMKNFKKKDDIWNSYSNNHTNFVVSYEDLEKGVEIEPLSITMRFSDETSFIKKNPSYKEKAFANYDQIVEWCNEYEVEFNLKQH